VADTESNTVTHSSAVVLQGIAKGYRHGFDIIELTGLGGSTVYPALRRLERLGLVSATWESGEVAQESGRPARRYYQLTPSGEVALREALNRFRFLRPFAAQVKLKRTRA
jgi:DNA-binding PadR family transcriptional regulator